MKATDRERLILTYIADYVRRNGYAPTVREISDGAGLSSTATTMWHLRRLTTKGCISRAPGKPRALVINPGVCRD